MLRQFKVQNFSNPVASGIVTLDSPVAAHSCLACYIGGGGPAFTATIADSLNSAWPAFVSRSNSWLAALLFAFGDSQGGGCSLTITPYQTASFYVVAMEFDSILAALNPVDKTVNGHASGALNYSVGPVTTGFPLEPVILGFQMNVSHTITPGAGYTLLTPATSGWGVVYQIAPTAGAVAASIGVDAATGTFDGALMSLKPAIPLSSRAGGPYGPLRRFGF